MRKRTILIAEDDADLATFLSAECRQLGFDVLRSPDAMHALLGVHRFQPSLIVLDLNMPGGNGLSVCEMLASDPKVCQIPVIVMSGQNDANTIRRCKLAGARYIRKGPRLWADLAAVMCQCLSGEPLNSDEDAGPAPVAAPAPAPSDAETSAHRPTILSVDDDADFSRVVKRLLEPYGVEVMRAFSGMQGFWSCLDTRPDVIISDLSMSDGDGNYLLHRLRTHTLTEKTPVIILTGQTNPAVRRQLLSQGALAYLTKPLDIDELLQHLRPLLRLTETSANCV